MIFMHVAKHLYGMGRALNVNKPFQTSHAQWHSCMPMHAWAMCFRVASFLGVLFFWRLGLRLFQSSRSLSVQQSAIYFALFCVWSVMVEGPSRSQTPAPKRPRRCATLTLSVYCYFTCIKVWETPLNQDAWLGVWQGCGSHTWLDDPWSYQQKVGAYVIMPSNSEAFWGWHGK